MKKLITILATIVVTIGAQAASVTWTMMQVQKSDYSGVASGYLAMVFAGDTLQSDVVKAVLARNTTKLGELSLDKWSQNTESNTSGMMRSAGNGSYSAQDSFSVYLVLFDAKSVADANYYFISDIKEGSINAAGANATIAFGTFDANKTATGKGWQPIPEPTSGLLILLGMAGLALRRKQK